MNQNRQGHGNKDSQTEHSGAGNGYSNLRNCLLHNNVATATTTSSKPAFLKIAQTSMPDRMRNLTNRYLHLCDKNLLMEPLLDFFRRSGLEKSSRASRKLSRADSIVSPWLAMSNSGHKKTCPSPSRSIKAVNFINPPSLFASV
jgi:hypothetical protein